MCLLFLCLYAHLDWRIYREWVLGQRSSVDSQNEERKEAGQLPGIKGTRCLTWTPPPGHHVREPWQSRGHSAAWSLTNRSPEGLGLAVVPGEDDPPPGPGERGVLGASGQVRVSAPADVLHRGPVAPEGERPTPA